MRRINLRIAELRKTTGFTQQEVAGAVGVSYQTVSKWENEKYISQNTGTSDFWSKFDIVLLSNDILEWSEYLTKYHQLNPYFSDKIISGKVHIRKPDERIFCYTLERIKRNPEDCIFVDNSVKELEKFYYKEKGL